MYEEANKSLRSNPEKEHRLMLLEAWRDFEEENGDDSAQRDVRDLMPKRVKKRRRVEDEDGNETGGWEEYFDYIFPEDEGAKPNLKLLAMAKMWKKNKEEEPPAKKAREEETEEEEKEEEAKDSEEKAQEVENPDADDEELKNESDSSSDDEEEEK